MMWTIWFLSASGKFPADNVSQHGTINAVIRLMLVILSSH